MDKKRFDEQIHKFEDRVYGDALKSSIASLNQQDEHKKLSQRFEAMSYGEQLR